MLTVSSSFKAYEKAPQGPQIARLISLIDLGTQVEEYKGKKKSVPKVYLKFELCETKMTEGDYAGQPFTLGKRYSQTLSEKSRLKEHLESWRGQPFTAAELEGFQLGVLLGKPCTVNVLHEPKQDGTVIANIKTITGVHKSIVVPKAVNDLLLFDLSKFDQSMFDSFPDWMKAVIALSPEFKKLGHKDSELFEDPALKGRPGEDDFDDDVPF